MDEILISKKDLMELTGISYGQLYRWKRKDLIPEEWFIRKSTFTGQETFFPKEKILDRIEKIKNMKEELSLDDLADVFTPNLTGIILKKEAFLEQQLASQKALDCFNRQFGDTEAFNFKNVLFIYLLEKMMQLGKVDGEESKLILTTLDENYLKLTGKNYDLFFIRKNQIALCFIAVNSGEHFFENGIEVINVNMTGCIEELKLKII